jgi:hypothetical protein
MLTSVSRAVRNFGAVHAASSAPAAARADNYSTAERYRHPRLNRRGEIVVPLRFDPSPMFYAANRETRRASGSNRFRPNTGLIPAWPNVAAGNHYHATKGERGGCL